MTTPELSRRGLLRLSALLGGSAALAACGGPAISDSMYGVFFEDINYAADGGLYAELVRNRSFEFLPVDNRSYTGLYLPPMVWGQLTNFSSGSVALVLASAHYDESDYYRDYDEWAAVVRGAA